MHARVHAGTVPRGPRPVDDGHATRPCHDHKAFGHAVPGKCHNVAMMKRQRQFVAPEPAAATETAGECKRQLRDVVTFGS